MRMVGFVDDNPRLLSKTLHGFRVLGGIDDLEKILQDSEISEVLISSKNVNGDRLEMVKEICSRNNVKLKSMNLTFVNI